MASDVQKLVVFVAASVLFLGIFYLFTSNTPITGASVTAVSTPSFLSSSPFIIFVVLGIVIYALLTIMKKHQ